MKYYTSLNDNHSKPNDIYVDAMSNLRSEFREKASDDTNYKYYIYEKMNPHLLPSPFLTYGNADAITRFRCGSHRLPIEALRWSRVPRNNRLYPKCHVLGDGYHYVFKCVEFPDYFSNECDLSKIWKMKNVFEFFKKMSETDYLKKY